MYESPIKVVEDAFNTQYENGVLRAVRNVGFHVDKLELTKALEYDRNQYIKGFEDAKAQYENPWIPCSERLPETDERVLLWVYGRVHIGKKMGHKLFEKYDVFDLENGTFESTNRIEAWMPLPEDWKGE